MGGTKNSILQWGQGPGAPQNPSGHALTLCFSPLLPSFAISPFCREQERTPAAPRLAAAGWAGAGRTPIPLGRDGQSPRQHPPGTGHPDPASSSLQSRRSVTSQLIASTHVCKLTVYRKMSRNVNFIRNALPCFYDGK